MAVVFKQKIAIFLIVFSFSILSCADSRALSRDEIDGYQLSLNKFNATKLALETAIEKCSQDKHIVDKKLLMPIDLTFSQLKTVLFVLNQRAQAQCEGDLREHFFYVAAIHRQVAKSYGLDAEDADNYTEDLLLIAERKKMDFEAEYLKIDDDIRGQLESITSLKKPFLLFETLQQFE